MYANELELDIVGVAETWLNKEVRDAEIALKDFKVYRKDRGEIKDSKGGGVLLYVRNKWNSFACEDFNKSKSESIFCKIIPERGNEIYVGVCYRSPNTLELEYAELFSNIRRAAEHQVLIMGDFNFPDIDWETLDAGGKAKDFVDLIQDCFLYQHVSAPTRGENLLDLVLTSEENMIEKVEIKEKLPNSDHNIVFFKMRYKSECKNSCVGAAYDYNKADFYEMRNFLNQINWEQKLLSREVNQMWCIFCDILNEIIKKCVPVIKKRKYKYPQWMTKEVKKVRNFKSKLWRRYRKSREYNDLVEYKRAANRATNEYKKAKLSFEKKNWRRISRATRSHFMRTLEVNPRLETLWVP